MLKNKGNLLVEGVSYGKRKRTGKRPAVALLAGQSVCRAQKDEGKAAFRVWHGEEYIEYEETGVGGDGFPDRPGKGALFTGQEGRP